MFSFDASVGRHVDHFDSDFVLSPLIGPTDVTRTTCMHLEGGGLVGEHEAPTDQLYCVVSGEGWVSGRDRVQVPIGQFQAAHWMPGELHAAGTETTMVAIVLEGTFSIAAMPISGP